MSDLLDVLREETLPAIGPLGFRVAEREISAHFDNSFVVFEGSGLRLRVLRERGVISLDVAPTFAPGAWVDSAVLVDYLGLSEHAGFHGTEEADVARGIGRFVSSMLPELQLVFGRERWIESARELEELKRRRAERLFG